jgi:hypothetical protein
VIQYEPTQPGLEIQAYLDLFGGSIADPDSIAELVISCALSDLASRTALSLMNAWMSERDISTELSSILDSAVVNE